MITRKQFCITVDEKLGDKIETLAANKGSTISHEIESMCNSALSKGLQGKRPEFDKIVIGSNISKNPAWWNQQICLLLVSIEEQLLKLNEKLDNKEMIKNE